MQENCSVFELCFLFSFAVVIFQLCQSRKHLVYCFRERSLEVLTLNELPLQLEDQSVKVLPLFLLQAVVYFSPRKRHKPSANCLSARLLFQFTVRVNSLTVSRLQC